MTFALALRWLPYFAIAAVAAWIFVQGQRIDALKDRNDALETRVETAETAAAANMAAFDVLMNGMSEAAANDADLQEVINNAEQVLGATPADPVLNATLERLRSRYAGRSAPTASHGTP
ncbi:hypothetical protein ACSMXM_05365 [Pacificimonas sp. ICDLI1SI03]